MSLQKFVLGMLLVVAAVTIWSIVGGASWGAVVFRAIACAIVLQVGYFVVMLAMIGRQPGKKPARTETLPPKQPDANSVTGGQKLSR